MKSIDTLPTREQFNRPMYTLAVSTPYNIKFFGNDCPGCILAWELRIRRRGWIDLGPNFGQSRIAPVLRTWTHVSKHYDDLYPEPAPQYQHCCPEQIDSYDDDGLLYEHKCGSSGEPPTGPIDPDEWFPAGYFGPGG